MSGTVARSWKTVAMPCSRASRGDLKCSASPSTSSSPSSCGCTPERILMKLDLPAPLSPSTHVTSPAPTAIETSFSAITLPKNFDMPRTSSSGGHRRAPSARWRTRLLTSTASSRITPRNRNRQSVFQPENWIPMNAMPTISAPSDAPIAEP